METFSVKELETRLSKIEQQLNSTQIADALARTSKIFPKKKTVIFIGKGYFGDNIKYAFLTFLDYAARHNINCYFLTDDRDQQALLSRHHLPFVSLNIKDAEQRAFKTLLETAVIVISDHFRPQSGTSVLTYSLLQGAKVVQLWHGIPLKEIGLQSLCSAEVMAACGPYDSLVATNQSSRRAWEQRFSFRRFEALGYPRNDIFFRAPTATDLINVDDVHFVFVQRAKEEGRRVILYAPTFRDFGGGCWLRTANLQSLSDHCSQKGCNLLVNLHPFEQHLIEGLRQIHPTITFLSPGTDAYPIAAQADILITDYSSIAFDFLLLDRPIVFYRPDHEDYISKSRPLIGNRNHYTTGPIATTASLLNNSLDEALNFVVYPDADMYRLQRHELRKELYDFVDGEAGSRLCSLISAYLDEIPCEQ